MPTSPRLPDETYNTIYEEFLKLLEKLHIPKSEANRLSRLPNGLTMKQILFCEAYLRNGGNSFEAAMQAGYKVKRKPDGSTTKGHKGEELLRNPKITKYIMDKMQTMLRVKNLSSDDVIAELIDVAMFNIKDVARWDGNSVTYKSSDEIPDHVAKCIKSVNEVKIPGGHKMIKVEFHDKMKALDTITKLMGLHQQTILHKHVNSDDEPITAEELEQELQRSGLLEVLKGQKPQSGVVPPENKIIDGEVVEERGDAKAAERRCGENGYLCNPDAK